MKNIINIVVMLAIAMSFTACQDWLDMESESKFDNATVFENVDRAEMAVIGCYTSIFNRELYYQLGMGTDECISTEGDTNSKNQVANYVFNTSNIPTSTYTAMYAGIEYANICIKKLSAMEGSSEAEKKKINMLLGECYAIRGMNYLNIVRFFGDVPYSTIPVEDAGTFFSSRVSRDIIMDGSVQDLQKAVELLPWQGEGMVTSVERFTKNSAYGILARVALYAAGYSLRWDLNTYDPGSVKMAQREDAARIKELYGIARDACKAVVDRGENDLIDYETVFRDLVNGRYNKESMLEYGQYGNDVNGSAIGYTNGMFCHTTCMFEKATPAMTALPTYWYDFEDGDVRRDVTLCNYGIAGDNTRQMSAYSSMSIGKFRVTWKKGVGTAINKRDINWPFLRYSDVLLMYAEAENELNKGITPTAKWAYEKVRLRGFKNNASKIGATPSSYQAFRDAIINERKLELGFEGMRRTDLVRWGIHFEVLTQAKQNVIDMANHTGKYANIDRFRAYKKEKATSFEDPVVAVSYIGYKSEPTADEKAKLKTDGYTLLDMYSNVSLHYTQKLEPKATWVQSIFRGLEKNKVELLPLNSETIDTNTGLKGQQHPLY